MGSTRLYLDTARLGRMTPRAQQAHLDFARLRPSRVTVEDAFVAMVRADERAREPRS